MYIYISLTYTFTIRVINIVLLLIRKTSYRSVPYIEILFVCHYITNMVQVNTIFKKKNKVGIFQTNNNLTNMNMITTSEIPVKKMIPNRISPEKIQKATQKYFMKMV